MDLLAYAQPPIVKTVGEGDKAVALSYSVLLNEDFVTMAAALRQAFWDLIDADNTIKSPVDRAKAKMGYTVGFGDVIQWAMYEPVGQAFALYLSLKRKHPDIKQEDITSLPVKPDEQFELVQAILGLPAPEDPPAAEGEGEKKETTGMTAP